ncbi:hypothetical protein LINPERPRIM_LOCUS31651 [Linum perenne]
MCIGKLTLLRITSQT